MNKLKIGYSPSKSELTLLVILLIVAIAALSRNYLLVPEWNALSANIQEYNNEKTRTENMRSEYDKLDTYLQEDEKLASDLEGLQQVIPDYFSEEEILSSLDANASKSGLNILGVSFSGVKIDTQSAFLAGLELSASAGGSAAADANSPADGSAAADPSAPSGGSAASDSSYVKSELVTISFQGSYANLMSFLSAIEAETRQVYFRNFISSRGEDGSLNGSLTMLVFSNTAEAPVANDPNYPGYDYQTPPASGKADPFVAFAGYKGAAGTAGSAAAPPDFYVILNTYDDNSSKVIMGKYPVSSAQVTSDSNQIVSAKLTLSKSGTSCSYTYDLDGESYSGSFTVNEGKAALNVSIISRARKSTLDNVGVTLNVKNDSGLPATITVMNDDGKTPRFHLGTTSGGVAVVK